MLCLLCEPWGELFKIVPQRFTEEAQSYTWLEVIDSLPEEHHSSLVPEQ